MSLRHCCFSTRKLSLQIGGSLNRIMIPSLNASTNTKVHTTSSSPQIDLKKIDPPQFIFKKVDKELGPGAGKDKEYKNPEYFSYHVMSYADLDVVMASKRCPQPTTEPSKSK